MKKSKIQERIDSNLGIPDTPKTTTNKNIQDIINSKVGIPTKKDALGPHNAVWDDGEWISWDEINEHIANQDKKEK